MNDPDDWVKGLIDNGLRFDGAWGKVTMSSLDGPSFPVNGTLSMWVLANWSSNTDNRPFWDESASRNLMSL